MLGTDHFYITYVIKYEKNKVNSSENIWFTIRYIKLYFLMSNI